MSERTPRRFAIAAATACLFGIVVPTATAGALPPLPAAPACAWTLNGPIRINHSDGVVVTIDMWRGGHPDGAAHEFSKDGKEVILDSNGHPPGGGLTAPFGSAQTGEVHGGINGDTITFKIDWALPINKRPSPRPCPSRPARQLSCGLGVWDRSGRPAVPSTAAADKCCHIYIPEKRSPNTGDHRQQVDRGWPVSL
jgi:hypothetical protein